MSNNTLFDTYIMVDWSARDEPGPQNRKENKLKKDNIWIGEVKRLGDGLSFSQTYCRTRARAFRHLEVNLQDQIKEGKRVLVGFDFAFGYPEGFAELLTGKADWKGVWEYLTENLEDDELNENNRFAMAAGINKVCESAGPFWGLAKGYDLEGITAKSPWKGVDELNFKDKTIRRLRHTDARTPGTQEVWKLYGAGSVGSQALTGIPVVWKLRNLKGLKKDSYIWPFETMMLEKEVLEKKAKVVFAEIFPSLADERVKELGRDRENNDGKPKDQLQVWAMTEVLAQADESGELMNWFVEAAALPKVVRTEEAAILQAPPAPEEEPKKKEKAEKPKRERKPRKEKKEKSMDPASRAREVEKEKNEKKKKQEEARKEREKKKEEARKKREEENKKRKEKRDKERGKLKEAQEKEKEKKKKEREEKQRKQKEEREAKKALKDKEREEKKQQEKEKKEEAKKAKLAEVEAKRSEKKALEEQEKRRREEKEKAIAAEREAARKKAEEEEKAKAAGSLKAQYERSKKDEAAAKPVTPEVKVEEPKAEETAAPETESTPEAKEETKTPGGAVITTETTTADSDSYGATSEESTDQPETPSTGEKPEDKAGDSGK